MTGLYNGVAGLSGSSGLWGNVAGLWSGATGLQDGSGGPALSLNFLSGTLDSRVTFTRSSTATFVGSNGFIQTAAINTPRFDYDPVTLAAKGLLIEEQRTNLLVRSEEFNNASWTKTATTVTADAAVSPDGTSNADKLVEDTSAGNHYISQLVTTVTSTTYTASVYLKAAGRNARLLVYQSASPFATIGSVTVDLSNGAVLSGSGTVASVGNGWYRVSVSGAAVDTATRVRVDLAQGTTLSYTGDGTSGIFIWGAQLEAGAFATSYIPTVASQVTRTADVVSMTGTNFSSWYNASEGTLLVEAQISPNVDAPSGNYYAAISDGTVSNTIHIAEVNGTRSQIIISGVVGFDQALGSEPTGVVKAALAYATNNAVSSVDGAIGATDTSVSIPTVNRLSIGARGDLATFNYLNGHIRSVTYYNSRLTNAQLQAVTA